MKRFARRGTVGLLALLLLCATGRPAAAEERIPGAFGVRFGDLFAPDIASETASLNDRIPLYQFTPEEPHRFLTRYYIEITPKTHMVYSIWGYGPDRGFAACQAEQAELLAELQPLFGSVRKRLFFAPAEDEKRIEQKDREILVKCTGHNAAKLLVRFTDRQLKEKAERERAAGQ